MNASRYHAPGPQLARGWRLTPLLEPSVLFGANGMRVGPDGALYVAQAFGSQISSLDPDSGQVATVVPVGSEIVAPDDLAFDSHGVMYVTEVMSERVSAQRPDGSRQVIADNVPVANGITVHDDRIFMDEFRVGGRLFELYPDGRAPRVIATDLVTPNALAMGPDGALYFPQVATGEIWRVAPEGGQPERVIDGLALPTAVKFSPRGDCYTTQGASGEVTQIDLQTRECTVVATLRPGIDNLAFAPDGRLFVSHFVDGGVAEIDAAGRERVLVPPGLLGPFGLDVGADGTIYVADGMSLAVLDSAARQSARPALLVNHDFPGFTRAVAAAPAGGCYVTTSAGSVARYGADGTITAVAEELGAITDLAVRQDGNLAVSATVEGQLLSVNSSGQATVMARGLAQPLGIAIRPDGSCFVAEAGSGRVVHVHNGTATAVVEGLVEPHGLALADAQLFIVDRGARRLLCHDLDAGRTAVVAGDLALGAEPGVVPQVLPGIAALLPGPLLPFADVTCAADGSLLLGADGSGAIYRVERTGEA